VWKTCFFKFLKVSSFKVKVFGREFFEFLRTSTFKFERVFVVVFVFKIIRIRGEIAWY
jgi:hypothetical protein